jgi:hypothetical protein
LVEQSIRNRQVIGSSPIVGSVLLGRFAANRSTFLLKLSPEMLLKQAGSARKSASHPSRFLFRPLRNDLQTKNSELAPVFHICSQFALAIC